MIKNWKLRVISIMLFSLIPGCLLTTVIRDTNAPAQQGSATKTLDISMSTNLAPKFTMTPFSTPLSNSTPIILGTPTSIQMKDLTACVAPEPTLKSASIQGAILFADKRNRTSFSDLTYLDPVTDTFKPLPESISFYDGFTNPSGEVLAYHHIEKGVNSLHLLNLAGEDTNIGWMDDWWELLGWLDNNQLAIKPKSLDNNVWIIDISSGKRENITPSLPNAYIRTKSSTAVDPIQWIVEYDPSLERVAYLSNENNQIGMVVRNLQEKSDLWNFKKYAVSAFRPSWSFDGKYFAAGAINDAVDHFNRFELYIIDQNGALHWHFDKQDLYKGDEPLSATLAWAPNNQELAISVMIPNGTKAKSSPLLIADITTGYIYNICLADFSPPFSHIFWSPKSDSLVLESLSKSFYVDLIHKEIYLIEENPDIYPIGWLSSIP